MANEAVLLKQFSIPTSVTVADGTGIEKGAFLALTDPNTGAAVAADAMTPAFCAGIAATEKIASDGVTKLAVHKNGEFRGILSGIIVAGDPVVLCLSGATWPNYLQSGATILTSGAQIIGHSLETAANGETFRFRLNLE